MRAQPDFDWIARPYRWLEYLTLGLALERCRLHFLRSLHDRHRALVLGDGDGRFLARLMQQNGSLTADAVDTSRAMLHLLRERCRTASTSSTPRLITHHTDALSFLAPDATERYDLVATHFFLDCLTQPELDQLAARVAARLAVGGVWIVSDFRIPAGPMRVPAFLLVRTLYAGFRILTGLRVTSLPCHRSALTAAGLTLETRHDSLLGLLTNELWRRSSDMDVLPARCTFGS